MNKSSLRVTGTIVLGISLTSEQEPRQEGTYRRRSSGGTLGELGFEAPVSTSRIVCFEDESAPPVSFVRRRTVLGVALPANAPYLRTSTRY
jgi:hypothetical protein